MQGESSHYLSIDVDFWFDASQARRALTSILDEAARRRVPVVAVTNHQQLLEHVEESEARTLVNLDMHSDLDGLADELNCGTWVEYVSWRPYGTYIWVRAHDDVGMGRCDGHAYSSKAPWDQDTTWRRTVSYHAEQDHVPGLEGCEGVGICLSPSYSSADVLAAVERLLRQRGIPVEEGKRDEDFVTLARSPAERDRCIVRAMLRTQTERRDQTWKRRQGSRNGVPL